MDGAHERSAGKNGWIVPRIPENGLATGRAVPILILDDASLQRRDWDFRRIMRFGRLEVAGHVLPGSDASATLPSLLDRSWPA
jgi:hypothetical protein